MGRPHVGGFDGGAIHVLTYGPMNVPLRRDQWYYFPNGEKYPSVTAITSSIPKPHLMKWAARVAAEAVLKDPVQYNTAEKAASVLDEIREGAADRGRSVHELIEAWARGEELDSDDGYVGGFKLFLRSWCPRPILAEAVVLNRTHGYAGRLDLIANVGGESWLLDFKTSRAPYPEYGLQLAAYKHAEYYYDGENFHPMPRVDHSAVVLLPGNGSFDLKVVDEPLEVFLAAKTLWLWTRGGG